MCFTLNIYAVHSSIIIQVYLTFLLFNWLSKITTGGSYSVEASADSKKAYSSRLPLKW